MYTMFFIKSGIVVSWHRTHCRIVWKYKYTFVLVNSFSYMNETVIFEKLKVFHQMS